MPITIQHPRHYLTEHHNLVMLKNDEGDIVLLTFPDRTAAGKAIIELTNTLIDFTVSEKKEG